MEEADTSESQVCNAHPQAFTLITLSERILYMQQGDAHIREVIRILMIDERERNKGEKGTVSGFKLRNGILYRTVKRRDLFVVPKSMRKGLVIAAHNLAGHFAVDRTIQKIQKDYWLPNMKRYIKQHIRMCIDCLVCKKPGGKKPRFFHLIPPGVRPFAVVHLDHVRPFETTTKKNKYVLVVINNLTKYVYLYPTRSTATQEVIKNLTELIRM